MANEMLKRYLDQYLKMVNTDFAVFINGEWGCGKTYFINDYVKDLPKKGHKYWRVSLNGVNDDASFGSRLLENIISPAKANSVQMLGRMAVGAASQWLKFDAKKFFNAKEMNSFLMGIAKRPDLIVIDDFERCAQPPSWRLGCISGLVESGYKVIIIGAENELDDKPDEAEVKPYRRIREKVIGKTFTLECDLGEVFESLVSKGVFTFAEKILLENKDALVSCIGKFCGSALCNLRALKHSFRDFDCFLSRVENRFLGNRQFTKDLVCRFVPLDYAKQCGEWAEEDFVRAIEPRGTNDKETIFEHVMERLGFDGRWMGNAMNQLIFADHVWSAILWDKPLSAEDITQALDLSVYFRKQDEEPDWLKLWQWPQIDKADVAAAVVEKVLQGLDRHAYKNPGEINHIFCCLAGLSKEKIGAVDLTIEQVVQKHKAYISCLTETGWTQDEFDDFMEYGDGWNGYRYWDVEGSDARQRIIQATHDALRSLVEKSHVDDFRRTVNNLSSDMDAFVTAIKSAPYDSRPCLSDISPEGFFERFMTLSNYNKRKLAWELQQRWQYSQPTAVGEKIFIDGVLASCKHYLAANKDEKGTPVYVNVGYLLGYLEHYSKLVRNIEEEECKRITREFDAMFGSQTKK